MSFTNWLRNLRTALTRNSAAHSRKKTTRQPSYGFRPMLESLEDRVVPSATLLTATTTVDINNDGMA